MSMPAFKDLFLHEENLHFRDSRYITTPTDVLDKYLGKRIR